MQLNSSDIVIRGITQAGRTFRPSDWSERISGVLSTFGTDHRMSYSPHVRPVTLDGVKCVIVNKKLEQDEPRAYNFLMSFARDNDLQVLSAAEYDAIRSEPTLLKTRTG